MKFKIFLVFVLFALPPLFSFTTKNNAGVVSDVPTLFEVYAFELYCELNITEDELNYDVFKSGLLGYVNLKKDSKLEKQQLLTLIDYSISSNKKRLWILDIQNRKLLFNTLVAHGKKSGEECAENFSNIPQSNQSSLGFFTTGDIYEGKHGMSLYLHGAERGINDKAYERYIVIHGADYVSEQFIEENGRLGRSLGCPAIPLELHQDIINTIAHRSCVFIYYPEKIYLETSALLDQDGLLFEDFS